MNLHALLQYCCFLGLLLLLSPVEFLTLARLGFNRLLLTHLLLKQNLGNSFITPVKPA